VSATFRQDKSVIGGAIVRIGSTIYDGSVRGRLERLKEQLISSE
jgi:F-type H+-transporting ATPase subunit delta